MYKFLYPVVQLSSSIDYLLRSMDLFDRQRDRKHRRDTMLHNDRSLTNLYTDKKSFRNDTKITFDS